VVDGDVEVLGEADQGFGGWGDAAGFVAADAPAVGADLFAEFGLGPAGFFAQGGSRSSGAEMACDEDPCRILNGGLRY
jgi:hypothetical protein